MRDAPAHGNAAWLHASVLQATLEAAKEPGARVLYFAPGVASAQLMEVSLVLYQQIVGRGLCGPAFGGT